MKNKILWIITAVLGLMLVMQQLQASQGVDVKTAQSMVNQGALLLDVREPHEYAAVHAVNAKLMPLGQVGMRLHELDAYKDKPVAVICSWRSPVPLMMTRKPPRGTPSMATSIRRLPSKGAGAGADHGTPSAAAGVLNAHRA